MRFGDPADHLLFIDEQASFDLAVGVVVEGHTWEAMRDALEHIKSCDPFRLIPRQLPLSP